MRECSKLIARSDQTLFEVIKAIDSGGLQVALICDSEDRLVGIVTDGDIRRAILQGVPLSNSVSGILNKDFCYSKGAISPQEALKILKARKLRILPVINDSKKLKGIFHIDDLTPMQKVEITTPVVIMAGGFGTRLKPLTDSVPKPMLKVAGKPILQLIIEHFCSQGFTRFILSVHYLADQIENYFGDGSNFGVNISYIKEAQPKGTAGSLSLLPEMSESFIVTNGDVLTKMNTNQLLAFHNASHAALTVGVKEHSLKVPYGVVQVEEGMVTSIEEKPQVRHLVSAGVYVVHPRCLTEIAKDAVVNMPEVIELLIAKSQSVSAFPIHEYCSDVGRHVDFRLAQKEFFQRTDVN